MRLSLGKCCMLTLDRSVDRRFSAQDAPVKISGGSHEENGNVWVLWNNICRCPHEIGAVWELVLSQSQLAITGALVSGWAPRWGSGPQCGSQRASGWVPTEAEVLSWVLKITQHGMVKRRKSYGSIWQPVFVSVCLSVSFTPTEALTPKKE